MIRLALGVILFALLSAGCVAPAPAPPRDAAQPETGLQEITILAKGLE